MSLSDLANRLPPEAREAVKFHRARYWAARRAVYAEPNPAHRRPLWEAAEAAEDAVKTAWREGLAQDQGRAA